MQVMVEVATKLKQAFLTIHAPAETPEIAQLKTTLEQVTQPLWLVGYQEKRTTQLAVLTVTRFYTADKQVWAETPTGTYLIHWRLYELMARLPERLFLRISSGEIVRLACIQHFELTRTGSFQVKLTTGATTFASRRYTRRLRKEWAQHEVD